MAQIDIRDSLESSDKMQMRRRLHYAAAITGEKMMVEDGSINLHDVAGLRLDDKCFKIHAVWDAFFEPLIVKAA